MGLLDGRGAIFGNIIFNQVVLGLFGGTIAFIITSKIPYKFWQKYAFWIFLFSLISTVLVFFPGIGFSHGGARRWIILGGYTIQTSEILKIGFIIYLSAWMSGVRNRVASIKYGLIPFVAIIALVGVVLLRQPDTDTFFVIFISGLAIFIVGGAKWRYVLFLIVVCIIGLFVFAQTKPYLLSRIDTFLNPDSDRTGSGYHFRQSLIAIGSGQITGRGFGQSIQKFNYLPEPIGDSVFAVASEEFGFVGGLTIVGLFLFFTTRGLKIASKCPDNFGRLVVVGIVILISSQAIVNIAAMLGVLPLSGIPLPFISHGGTALFMILAEMGIVVNISKNRSLKSK